MGGGRYWKYCIQHSLVTFMWCRIWVRDKSIRDLHTKVTFNAMSWRRRSNVTWRPLYEKIFLKIKCHIVTWWPDWDLFMMTQTGRSWVTLRVATFIFINHIMWVWGFISTYYEYASDPPNWRDFSHLCFYTVLTVTLFSISYQCSNYYRLP